MDKWLQNNAGIEDDWQQTKANVLTACWSNAEDEHAGLTTKSHSKDRMKLFKTATQGIVAAAAAAQPWSDVMAEKYEKLQLD